jgi:quercetin dioxygenase-like cupin family protein
MKGREKTGAEPVESAKLIDMIGYQEAAVVSREVIAKETGTITLFAFDKGQGLSEHTAPFDAFVFVLDGRVEIRLGGVPHVLGPGETITMPAQVAHALKALERFKMLLVMVRS